MNKFDVALEAPEIKPTRAGLEYYTCVIVDLTNAIVDTEYELEGLREEVDIYKKYYTELKRELLEG